MTTKAPTDLTIRWLIRRDMPEIMEIENASFDVPWSHDEFVGFLRQRSSIALVAERDDEILGFIVYELKKDSLEITNFAVSPNHRRKGIGRAIIEKLKKKLGITPRRKIAEIVIRESNLGAQLFFRECGFRCIATCRNYYQDSNEDGYRMSFSLVPEPMKQGTNRISQY